MKEPLSTSTPIKDDKKKQVQVVAMSPKSQDEDETPSPKPKTMSSPLFSFKSQLSMKERKMSNEKYQRTDDYAQVSFFYTIRAISYVIIVMLIRMIFLKFIIIEGIHFSALVNKVVH